MELTVAGIAAATGARTEVAHAWLQPLTNAMQTYDIWTPSRAAAFLAQVGHESAHLTAFEENLMYRPQRLVQIWPNRFRMPRAGEPSDAPLFADGKRNAMWYGGKPERIANSVYANRYGNRSETSGDGWKYRGRGPIQITFLDNYAACGEALCLDLVNRPELLLNPHYGAMSAAWYWDSRRLNELADQQDVVAITKRVNGGTHGLDQRIALFNQGIQAIA